MKMLCSLILFAHLRAAQFLTLFEAFPDRITYLTMLNVHCGLWSQVLSQAREL
jgi:hypothetical protein